MERRIPIIALILVTVGALVGGLGGRLPAKASDSGVTREQILRDYGEALDVIDANYAGKIDRQQMTDSSMQSTLWTLDPHSSFFDRAALKKMDEEQSSQFYGIGVSIMQHHNGVYVQSIVPGTPAEKAGLHYGDRFLTVDGKDATDWTASELSKNVRGERGTTVKVSVERVGSQQPLAFEIVRGGVPLPSVRNSFMLPNNIGYIGFTGGFQQTSAAEVASAIAELKKQGMKGLLLDLRGNPGGILEQAIEIVSDFIPAGKTVVSVKSSRSDAVRELRTTGGTVENFPLVLLINGGSASASEIVAGAMQDYGRGLIVGTDSFGKGLVQRVFRLPYGTGMTLTTARYYTPYGRSLQRDYSNGSIYDYYSHDEDAVDAPPKPVGVPVTMPDGRVLYGGRGIEPDIVAPPAAGSQLKSRINEAAFLFVRQLVGGKVAGFEAMKVERQNFRLTLAPGEFAVSDKLYDAFRSFAAADKEVGLTADNIGTQTEYAKMRLREEIATANCSNEAGIQVLLEGDQQVVKAVQSMPDAAKLVQSFALLQNIR
ncbi:MAG: S41 family peptidase [Chloracidobacterium sp.]|nr:S41 family peptidase [Chloracidobacterium sp.]MCO5333633.1 S41 family peptidase [Pyrinomonadaceae bacterium]